MRKFVVLTLIVFIGISCTEAGKRNKEKMVLLKTEFGNIKLKLYDDTPKHKQNFLKLINEGFYNGLLFHRVINGFMIQGGDPESKKAKPGMRLGGGDPGYTIPAEINPGHFHKKGALAAARTGGPSNPEKRSSGSQFYIVQGEVFSQEKLDTLEMKLKEKAKNAFFRKEMNAHKGELDKFVKQKDKNGFYARAAEIRIKTDSLWKTQSNFSFTPEQRKAYTTVGGYPSLDGEYTVFGEVVEGFDVLDSIAAVKTDRFDRPLDDIKMKMEIVDGKSRKK